MSRLYGESHRQLQRRFDTERLADRIEERLFREHVTDDDRAFIERMDMLFLATADAHGRPNCSYKGGDPGFVRVIDPRTLVFPNYDGNGMYLSMGNVLENPSVGLLFIDFANQKRLRVNGVAEVIPASSVDPPYPEAQFIVQVSVQQVFPNCPVTSTGSSRSSPRSSCRAPRCAPRCPGGSVWSGPATCCRRAIRRAHRRARSRAIASRA